MFTVTELVDESLSGPTLEAVGEGLTEEELELAKLLLQVNISQLFILFYTPMHDNGIRQSVSMIIV